MKILYQMRKDKTKGEYNVIEVAREKDYIHMNFTVVYCYNCSIMVLVIIISC